MKTLLLSIIALCAIACSSIKSSPMDSTKSEISGPSIVDDKLIMGTALDNLVVIGEDKLPSSRPAIFRNTAEVIKHIDPVNNFSISQFIFCINRAGSISYLEYIEDASKDDFTQTEIKSMMRGLSTYKFKPDSTAHEQECFTYTLKFGNGKPEEKSKCF